MEYMDIVNENDEVIGRASRKDALEKSLRRRIVHVMISDKSGRIFLQRRSEKVAWCPNHWSSSAGGHVLSGEDYEATANRELKEELGIATNLEFIEKIFYDVPGVANMFLSIYRTKSNGPFDYDKNDIAEIRAFSISEIKKMLESGEKFHPELIFILNKYYFKNERPK